MTVGRDFEYSKIAVSQQRFDRSTSCYIYYFA